jgi:dethiobiotin synthetase
VKTPAQKMVFITGTDTGVGKTVITAGLAAGFRRRGYKALAVKPYQTGIGSTYADADVYDFDGPQPESRERINPVLLEPPAAPWAASLITGISFNPDSVRQGIVELAQENDVLFIEGAGGICVPISREHLMLDLIRELGCPLIIVARGRLGTINHSLLTIRAAEAAGIPVLGIIYSGLTRGIDKVCDLNPEIIQQFSGVRILGEVPVLLTLDIKNGHTETLMENLEKAVQYAAIEELIFDQP